LLFWLNKVGGCFNNLNLWWPKFYEKNIFPWFVFRF
jgi:hypothetical protein